MPVRCLVLLLCLLAAAPGSAAAHSFAVAFLVPLTGAQAPDGRQAIEGFLLATDERDAHGEQESDGHLGGLDVYVLLIDTAAGEASAARTLAALLADAEVQIVTGLDLASLPEALRTQLQSPRPLVLDLAAGLPAIATTQDGEPFAAAFASRHGRTPGASALAGYRGARVIDRLVRAVAGDFADRPRLEAALAAALRP